MNDIQIKEYTRVIAEFLEIKETEDVGMYFTSFLGTSTHAYFEQGKSFDFFLTISKFISSYDWQMKAWDKFKNIRPCSATWNRHCANIERMVMYGTLLESFTALAEAIIWYNENKE